MSDSLIGWHVSMFLQRCSKFWMFFLFYGIKSTFFVKVLLFLVIWQSLVFSNLKDHSGIEGSSDVYLCCPVLRKDTLYIYIFWSNIGLLLIVSIYFQMFCFLPKKLPLHCFYFFKCLLILRNNTPSVVS